MGFTHGIDLICVIWKRSHCTLHTCRWLLVLSMYFEPLLSL